MGSVQAAVHKAASALSAQLALTFFMPLCLTAIAILARIRVSQADPCSSKGQHLKMPLLTCQSRATANFTPAKSFWHWHCRCWQASGCSMQLQPTMCSLSIFQHCPRTSPMKVHQLYLPMSCAALHSLTLVHACLICGGTYIICLRCREQSATAAEG